MNRIFITLLILSIAVFTFAQNQQIGRVKTRGRMVNGVLQPGVGIQGAIVQVKGRSAVLSGNDGNFSFPLQSNTFLVQSVQKQGYQLVDMELCRSYKSSSDPIYLVMETPEQQKEDRLAAERKLRRTLQRQLQEREEEIDAMKISIDEKNHLLEELYKKQENNEKLIAEMAKEYAALDYDQMDALNQRISYAILNGQLTEADSLLRSKGDILSRIVQIKREQHAEQTREEEIIREQKELAISRTGTRKKLEDVANDCYRFFERFKLESNIDSATFYIELRAELDTTNVQWQFDAGLYIQEQASYSKHFGAKKYYLRILNMFESNKTDVSFGYNLIMNSTVKLNLGILYNQEGKNDEALESLFESLEERRKYAKQSPNPNDEGHVAWVLVTIANKEISSGNLEDAKKHLDEVAEIYQRLLLLNPKEHEWATTRMYTEYCAYYHAKQNDALEEKSYDAAKRFIYKYINDNPEWYASHLRRISFFRFSTLRQKNLINKMEEMLKEDIKFLRKYITSERIFSDIHNYEGGLAHLYYETGKFLECEAMYVVSLRTCRRLAKSNPHSYDSYVVMRLGNLSFCEIFLNKYVESEQYAREGLAMDSTQHWISTNLAASLLFQGKYTEAEKIYVQYKSELKESFLDDFNKFAEAGVIPKKYEADVEKIKKMLSEE